MPVSSVVLHCEVGDIDSYQLLSLICVFYCCFLHFYHVLIDARDTFLLLLMTLGRSQESDEYFLMTSVTGHHRLLHALSVPRSDSALFSCYYLERRYAHLRGFLLADAMLDNRNCRKTFSAISLWNSDFALSCPLGAKAEFVPSSNATPYSGLKRPAKTGGC